jgi:hypothetical protein
VRLEDPSIDEMSASLLPVSTRWDFGLDNADVLLLAAKGLLNILEDDRKMSLMELIFFLSAEEEVVVCARWLCGRCFCLDPCVVQEEKSEELWWWWPSLLPLW